MLQSISRSYARPACRTAASFQAFETICKPIGSPVLVNPHRTERAGKPVRLKGDVNCVRRRACSMAAFPSINGAGIGVEGNNRRSY